MSEKENKGLKSFNEMMEIDVSKYTQKKPTFYKDKTGKLVKAPEDKWLDYIEWGMVLALLYKNGAESVKFWSEQREEKQGFLFIHVVINGVEYTLDYPIINGNKVLTSPNPLDIHKAEMRGFVKCVAINTGLGLKLWLKEETQLNDTVEETPKAKPEPKKQSLSDERFNNALKAIQSDKTTAEDIRAKFALSKTQDKQLTEFVTAKNEGI